MGWSCGRKLTYELLADTAKQYRSKSEFQSQDSSAYATARTNGWLDDITQHMINIAFSIPQLICQQLFDHLLNRKSLYNSRKIISPYELDIYYEDIKFAVEYDGKGWHQDDDAKRREINKNKLIEENNIYLVRIVENSRKYEEDIKNQVLNNIEFKNKFNIKDESITSFIIDFDKIYDSTSRPKRIEQIKDNVSKYNNIKEFSQNHSEDYNYIKKNKLHYLISHLDGHRKFLTNEELYQICSNYTNYSEFVKSKYYKICYRRNLLKEFSKHMKKDYIDRKDLSNEDLLKMWKDSKYVHAQECRDKNNGLYLELKRRKIFPWSDTRRTHKKK